MVQKRMDNFMGKKQAVQIKDCEIKQSRRGDRMEILFKADTCINETVKKLKCLMSNFSWTLQY